MTKEKSAMQLIKFRDKVTHLTKEVKKNEEYVSILKDELELVNIIIKQLEVDYNE